MLRYIRYRLIVVVLKLIGSGTFHMLHILSNPKPLISGTIPLYNYYY